MTCTVDLRMHAQSQSTHVHMHASLEQAGRFLLTHDDQKAVIQRVSRGVVTYRQLRQVPRIKSANSCGRVATLCA